MKYAWEDTPVPDAYRCACGGLKAPNSLYWLKMDIGEEPGETIDGWYCLSCCAKQGGDPVISLWDAMCAKKKGLDLDDD